MVSEPVSHRTHAVVDGNEAVARVAHALSEIVAIYPITPASAMGELADEWSAAGRTNVWGVVPQVVEMQSEAGAAAALHGALARGALATTFTSSQGLLLMLPNMFKIAGELSPTVVHVAARSLATHALSIFGDHSDVMAARTTGFAMLCASSVQEAADFAAVAHTAALDARVPFLHFFDGFRTSHEVDVIEPLSRGELEAMIDPAWISAHRARALDPDRPVLRGSAQNPDVFFQSREAANPFHAAVPGAVRRAMARIGAVTGRSYDVVDYHGAPDADRVIVIMGSAAGAVTEAVDELNGRGDHVGVAVVRLFRPFPSAELRAALPASTRTVAVLDRTKEPGAPFEPLHLDVLAALRRGLDTAAVQGRTPRVIGGRYGLGGKEFTPAMAAAVFTEAASADPREVFTVGIDDDVTGTSLAVDPTFTTDRAPVRAVFYGLGSDGSVGGAKATAKIIGARPDLHVQAYFVYDSKKSGSMTTSHLRVSPTPLQSTYLIDAATFVGVHQWGLFEHVDVLARAAEDATVVINCPWPASEVWGRLPEEAQRTILDRRLRLFTIDAESIAAAAGIPGRVNTVMQVCFFALAGVVPTDEAIELLKRSIRTTYAKRGATVVDQNIAAVDAARAHLAEVPVGPSARSGQHRRTLAAHDTTAFEREVTCRLIAGEGDLLPVSAMPPDGTYPTGTARLEKRGLASEIPIWQPDLCIDCGKCTIVCPHAAIRMKVYDAEESDGPAHTLRTRPFRSREVPGKHLTIQVAPDDCTGCGLCVTACSAHDRADPTRRALMLEPIEAHLAAERAAWDAFLAVPATDPAQWDPGSVKTSQLRRPLFEFSGACAGCGETPYLKLLTQLFGDHLLIANATGCSSIYGGNLPTTPYARDDEGRGPAWSNSLFEDNAEYGLGQRLALDGQRDAALQLVRSLAAGPSPAVRPELAAALEAGIDGADDAHIREQRERVAELRRSLAGCDRPEVAPLLDLAGALVRKSVWIVGGDGWAYDIGAAGLDHVLASRRNVNVLVLDTEVYSNTGGQASKATPRGAVARFAAGGRRSMKKDLALAAMAYGDVYVARVALGANDGQTVKALLEAEAWPGVSLVIAYSTCIAHGFDMSDSMRHQKSAVQSGHWPLLRYRPDPPTGERALLLDSAPPSIPYADFTQSESRFAAPGRSDPVPSDGLSALGAHDAIVRWHLYEQLAALEHEPNDPL